MRTNQKSASLKSGVLMNGLLRQAAKGVFAAGLACGVALALSGCNTTEGVGKDVKSVGKGIEEAAADNK